MEQEDSYRGLEGRDGGCRERCGHGKGNVNLRERRWALG